MKICQEHWDKLRRAIRERGLYHLVSKSGEEDLANIKASLEGEKSDYDPLMDCNWMIMNRALASGGLYLMGQKEDGTDYCPICEAETNGEPKDSWINGPADAALNLCRKKGLVPAVQ